MILTVRPLNAVCSVNVFTYATNFQFTSGDGPALYFQLVDASLDFATQGINPSGRRYCPASGATLAVTFPLLDSSQTFTRFATQPYPGDASIWMVQLLSTDPVVGSMDMRLVLTEGPKTTYGTASKVILANSTS